MKVREKEKLELVSESDLAAVPYVICKQKIFRRKEDALILLRLYFDDDDDDDKPTGVDGI